MYPPHCELKSIVIISIVIVSILAVMNSINIVMGITMMDIMTMLLPCSLARWSVTHSPSGVRQKCCPT